MVMCRRTFGHLLQTLFVRAPRGTDGFIFYILDVHQILDKVLESPERVSETTHM